MTAEETLTRLTRSGQITLPAAIRRQAQIEEGDLIAVALEGDRIILTPKKLIDKSQAYFWSRQWQQAEREAEQDVAEGRLSAYQDADQLVADLEANEA